LNNGSNGVEELEATFEGYCFRHFPDATASCLRWQAGRNVVDTIELPDGSGLLIDYFQLIAWSETSEELIDKLSAID